MPKAKIVLMWMAVAVLAIVAVFAFSAPVQMSARRETSEVTRLLSEREFARFQIAWVVLGVLATGSALILGRRTWRLAGGRAAQR
jgi:hypothetical protein